jgi:hypothetical protein
VAAAAGVVAVAHAAAAAEAVAVVAEAVVRAAAIVAVTAVAEAVARAMAKSYRSGKRDREAKRDQKNQEKQARLQRNRDLRARGIDPTEVDEFGNPRQPPPPEPEVALEDIEVGVPSSSAGRRKMPMRLFVGGLSWDTSDEELRKAFEAHGEVVEAVVIKDRGTGRSRGFGFVTYADANEGKLAMRELDGSELDGRSIKVGPADTR